MCDAPVARLLLAAHALCGLPPAMALLDPARELIEVVVWPLVKYAHRERLVACIPLDEHVLQFSPASISHRRDQLVVDLDDMTFSPCTSRAEMSTALRGASARWWSTASVAAMGGEDDGRGESGKEGGANGGRLLLQYPCPSGLRTHVDVMIGVRQRRVGSSSVRWITKKWEQCRPVDGVGRFSVALETVHAKKSVTRIVGLNIGGAVFSVAVNPNDDRGSILCRLQEDKRRYSALGGNNVLEDVDVEAMLRGGLSEEAIHRHMLLLVDPNYYLRRLEKLFALYPSFGGAGWQQPRVLLEKYAFREEKLMRLAAMEIGPECQNVFELHRLSAFRRMHFLSDESILTYLRSVVRGSIYEKLVTDAEGIFDALTKQFGEEPQPSSYLFPARKYTIDRRIFFLDVLRDLIQPSHEKHRDESQLSRNTRRPPFTTSPREQPLRLEFSGLRLGESISEIEMLRKKYAPEFAQIVPSIAIALQTVVDKNKGLTYDDLAVDDSFLVFERQGSQQPIAFYDFVQRATELTFISPASALGAMIYLDRLCLRYPDFIITERNVCSLFLTSVRVASKVLELRSINNRHFAGAFGLDTRTMNLLEEIFVKCLQFDLFLSLEEFEDYAHPLRPPNVDTPRMAVLPQQCAGATMGAASPCVFSGTNAKKKKRFGECNTANSENNMGDIALDLTEQRGVQTCAADFSESTGAAVVKVLPGTHVTDDVGLSEHHSVAGGATESNMDNTFSINESNSAGDVSRIISGGVIQTEHEPQKPSCSDSVQREEEEEEEETRTNTFRA